MLFRSVVEALAAERAAIAAAWNTPGKDGLSLSYAQIASLIGGSRSKAQQLVERGRRLP